MDQPDFPMNEMENVLQDFDDDVVRRMLEDPELFNSYALQNYSIFEECIKPTIIQMFQSAWVLLVCCVIIRFASILRISQRSQHLISFTTGLVVLWHFYGWSTAHIVGPCAIACLLYQFSPLRRGAVFSLLAVVYLLLCEKFVLDEQEWNKTRGSVMITCMKIISLVIDNENGALPKCDIFEFYGFVFNPASVIFGPFITYSEYRQILLHQPMSMAWTINTVRCFCISMGFLVWSTCGTENVLSRLGSNRWIEAYKDANAFRSSHYFVSFMSEGTCLLAGIGTATPRLQSQRKEEPAMDRQHQTRATDSSVQRTSGNVRKRVHAKVDESFVDDLNRFDATTTRESRVADAEVARIREEPYLVKWHYPVAKPLQVEIPRSLVDVVTTWNLPMHYWLKTYVFKSTRKFGVFPAILLTYMASSLLHSLNFQLSVVLLSIGIFAYIENAIRFTLSEVFKACILARRCKPNCGHLYKHNHPLVILANLCLGTVAIWNLAYLGCLFDSSPEVQEKRYIDFRSPDFVQDSSTIKNYIQKRLQDNDTGLVINLER